VQTVLATLRLSMLVSTPKTVLVSPSGVFLTASRGEAATALCSLTAAFRRRLLTLPLSMPSSKR